MNNVTLIAMELKLKMALNIMKELNLIKIAIFNLVKVPYQILNFSRIKEG